MNFSMKNHEHHKSNKSFVSKTSMKTSIKKILFLPVILSVLLFNSCQEESIETFQEEEEQVLVANSTVATLMQRTATRDGSYDNIIDNASCIDIVLPVTVFVNGLEIIVDSEEDFEVIEAIFDQLHDDEDSLDIVFPITIVLSDYREIVIENQAQLEEFIAECHEDDDDIECVDFQYPITYSVFDTEENMITTITIHNDEEMYRFLEEIDVNDIISLNFPITLEFFDGEEVIVNNLTELEDILERAINYCDEDDDNDYGDDDFTIERLNELLVICPWIVHSVERNDDNLDDEYRNFLLTFYEDGVAKARGLNGQFYEGTWNTQETDNGVVLSLTFNDLNDFTLEWYVDDLGEFRIRLHNGNDNHIVLEKHCDNNSTDCSLEQVDDFLEDCVWNIVSYNGDDNLIHYELNFDSNYELFITNTDTNEQTTAIWASSQLTNESVLIDFGSVNAPNIQAIDGAWYVYECSENRIKFMNNIDEYFIIEKQNCYEPSEFENTIQECKWKVASLINQGTDIANEYEDFRFTFNQNQSIFIENNNDYSVGSWDVSTTNSGTLAALINVGGSSWISDYYHVISLNDEVIEFLGSDEKVLILERICENDSSDDDIEQINDWLLTGQWEVALLMEDSNNNTDDFDNIEFNFEDNNDVIATDYNPVTPSSHRFFWQALRDDNNVLRMVINMDGQIPFYKLTDDWYITEVSENRIELHYINDGSNTENVIVFEKI